MLTREIVRELLDYDPETGVLTHRVRDRKWFKNIQDHHAWNMRFAGKEACPSPDSKGYKRVCILHRQYRAHRVIWLWMTGSWPEHSIDHENHVRTDNRWVNLREATQVENLRNQTLSPLNTSGTMGVSWHRRAGKWMATIKVGGRQHYIGLFADKSEAIEARKRAEDKHRFHPNHGRAAA